METTNDGGGDGTLDGNRTVNGEVQEQAMSLDNDMAEGKTGFILLF